MENIPIYIIAAVTILIVITLFWLIKLLANRSLKQQSHLLSLEHKLQQYHEITVTMEQTITRHYKLTSETKQRVDELAQHIQSQNEVLLTLPPIVEQIHKIQNDVQLLQNNASENRLYGRAKKMVEMGADIDELMSECEIPRAEAELLYSMYKK